MTPVELTAWRTHWQYSQSELARALGMRYESVGRWELGKVPVPSWLPLALETLARRRAADYLERAKGPTARVAS